MPATVALISSLEPETKLGESELEEFVLDFMDGLDAGGNNFLENTDLDEDAERLESGSVEDDITIATDDEVRYF